MIDSGPIGTQKIGRYGGSLPKSLRPKIQKKRKSRNFYKPLRGETVGTQRSEWRQTESIYSGGRWSDGVHQDGSRYYRSPDGNLYKIWPNGARKQMRASSQRKF